MLYGLFYTDSIQNILLGYSKKEKDILNYFNFTLHPSEAAKKHLCVIDIDPDTLKAQIPEYRKLKITNFNGIYCTQEEFDIIFEEFSEYKETFIGYMERLEPAMLALSPLGQSSWNNIINEVLHWKETNNYEDLFDSFLENHILVKNRGNLKDIRNRMDYVRSARIKAEMDRECDLFIANDKT